MRFCDRFRVWALVCAVLGVLLVSCRSEKSSRPAPLTTPSQVSNSPESVILAIDKQEHIWEIEHVAFELEQKFGKNLGLALRQRETEVIRGFCREGFEASLPSSAQTARYDVGLVQEERTDVRGALDGFHDATELANYLQSLFVDFDNIENISCRVLDLHADKNDPATGYWDVTLYLAGVGKDRQHAFVEFTSEHQLRCYFTDDEGIEGGRILDRWAVRSAVHRHSASPLFEEVTRQVGLDQVDIQDNWNVTKDKVRQYDTQMAVADFDRDGFHDLAVASANGRWRLLRSMAGERFAEVTDECGLPAWADEEPRSRSIRDQAYLVTWIDIDNDGYPDLILGDRVYQNQQGRRFEDVTEKSGIVFGYNPRGCVVADYDCDGRLDLYVLYQLPRTANREETPAWVGDDDTGLENHLWRNVGDGCFENTTEFANAGGGKRQSFAASWFHANDDHFPDLYIANDFGTNVLLLNQGDGKFRDESAVAGVSDFATSMGVATGDLTGDGRPEIYVANMFSKMGRRIIAHVAAEDYPEGIFQQIQGSCAGNRLYVASDGEGSYREISEGAGVNTVGWAYAPALADFDADGQLDIYATTGFLSYQRGKPDG
ncbi:MAG: VCBS repeat-containing protein [Planctomycetales bacterium]|nr:VCBS repeat-containing protein [Planctomycetales bacterium]